MELDKCAWVCLLYMIFGFCVYSLIETAVTIWSHIGPGFSFFQDGATGIKMHEWSTPI